MARRGFSLIELLFVVAISALVLGVTVSLYSFSLTRLAQGTANFATEDQARKLLDEIEAIVRDSISVTVVSGASNSGLKCTLAQLSQKAETAVDLTGSKTSKSADPIGVTKRGLDKHGMGKRIWFFLGNSVGSFGSAGSTVWRAERSDDSNPTSSDLVHSFTTYSGTSTKRFPLLTTLTYSVDAANRTVTITASARSLWRDERSGDASETASQTFTETRTIGWRHWFK